MTPFQLKTENFVSVLAIHLHKKCFGGQKMQTGFKVQVFENDTVIVSM